MHVYVCISIYKIIWLQMDLFLTMLEYKKYNNVL